mgnify:CR=1 FL=1
MLAWLIGIQDPPAALNNKDLIRGKINQFPIVSLYLRIPVQQSVCHRDEKIIRMLVREDRQSQRGVEYY